MEQSTTTAESVLFKHHNKNVLEVIFNQPKKLNAIDKYCIQRLDKHFLKYLPADIKEAECIEEEDVDIPRVVMFSGAGNVFCAGGDVKETYANIISEKFEEVLDTARIEAALYFSLSLMEPVQVVIWNGYVMGSGAGISFIAPVRIATDNTVFAMPETSIGMFPDVGAVYFLPKLLNNNYEIALYIGLIGHRLNGKEALNCGLATHYVKQENIEALKQAVIEKTDSNTDLAGVRNIIKPFTEGQYDPSTFSFSNQEIIKKVFQLDSMNSIYDRLEEMKSSNNTEESSFAGETLEKLNKMSPLMMVLYLIHLRRAKHFESLTKVYEDDYNLFNR
jgi:3-hydroxyisobutyryl-CoA hydrolase